MLRPAHLWLVCAALAACRAGTATRAAAAEAAYRFPHDAAPHRSLACVACHPTADVLAGRDARPGAADHAPCDRSGCHAEAFARPPARLCTLCHARVEPWREGGTTPAPYPPASGARALASRFSHRRHLDAGRMERAARFHLGCTDCHRVRAERAELPGHAACGRCHRAGAGPEPRLGACAGCHDGGTLARARRLIRGDLHFSHAAHVGDAGGRAITCLTCHAEIGGQERAAATATPAMEACVTCHDDPRRTPPTAAMDRCGICHQRTLAGFARLVAPRSHLGERYRPDDHTLAFRKDHAAEARREAARCARCHASMSGASRDNCDECHQTMRPADHVVTWRELEHGPDAAASATRCAVCHDGEYCTACHSRRPRSHAVPDFAASAHASAARTMLRSCFACHDVAAECGGCHTGFSP